MSDSTTTPTDLRALPDPADPRATAEAIMFEIRRVIVGQDAMLERVLVGLLSAAATSSSKASPASPRP